MVNLGFATGDAQGMNMIVKATDAICRRLQSQYEGATYFLFSGLAPEEIWFTSEGFAEALVRMQRRYRFDGILINIPWRPQGFLDHVRTRERNADGLWLTLDTGDRVFIPNDDNAQFYPADDGRPTRADWLFCRSGAPTPKPGRKSFCSTPRAASLFN